MVSHKKKPLYLYESSKERCEKDLANEIQLIIPDKAHRNVLLAVVGLGKWRLPGSLGDDIDTISIAEIRGYVKERMGLDFEFILLRQVHSQELSVERPDLDATLIRTIVVVECIKEPLFVPDGLQWVPIIDPRQRCLVNVTHSEEDAQREIQRELHGIANDTSPSQRVPWAFLSWHENTKLWVREVFDRHDLHMIGPMEQIKTSAHSTVLKINTNQSSYFVKCSSSTSNDAGVTSVMSDFAPRLVRKPLVVDVERRLMILKDHGEDFGVCALSDDLRKEFMKSLARLHETSASVFAKLVDVGLPTYSPQWMIDNLDALLHAKELVSMQGSALWESLHSIKKQVIDDLVSIGSWEMPHCLVHNDVFSGNLTHSTEGAGKGFCFFDFDSSFGGHPFLDLYWCSRELLEVYAVEMGFSDVDRLFDLSGAANRIHPLLNAFRYIERVRGAEEGGERNNELDWVMRSLDDLVLLFKCKDVTSS